VAVAAAGPLRTSQFDQVSISAGCRAQRARTQVSICVSEPPLAASASKASAFSPVKAKNCLSSGQLWWYEPSLPVVSARALSSRRGRWA